MSGSIVFLHYPSDKGKINVCLGLAQHITTTFSSASNAECVKRCTQYYPKGFYAVCIPHKIWCSLRCRLPGKSKTHAFILFIPTPPPPNPSLASNNARNVTFQMIHIWSSQHLCTKLWRFLTGNTNALVPQNGDDDMCYKQHALTEFMLPREKSSNTWAIFSEALQSTETLLVAGQKQRSFQNGKAELHDLCHWHFLSQLLALRCC